MGLGGGDQLARGAKAQQFGLNASEWNWDRAFMTKSEFCAKYDLTEEQYEAAGNN